MSSASSQFYQTAKGSLAMRLNNAEQLAESKKQEGVGLQQQIMAYNEEMEHAKANRDTAIFGLSLGGSGAYKLAYGAGSAIGKRILSRQTARLQSAIDEFKKGQKAPTEEEETTPEEPTAPEAPEAPAAPEDTPIQFSIDTPSVSVQEEGVGGTVQDAYGRNFDPKTLDMSDPDNPKPFPPDETPQEFPQTQEVARDGYGNRFDPSKVDTESYNNPEAVRGEDVMGAESVEEQPVTTPQAGIEADAPSVSRPPAPTEIQPAGEIRVQTIPEERTPIRTMGDDIRTQAATPAEELNDAEQARFADIVNDNPILTKDHIGTLKQMGADFGDLSPEEIDQGARMIMGDSAVEGLSGILDAAGSVIGSALPVLGLAGDVAGIYFAAKGLQDSKDAVQQEMDDKAKAVQALADTNIPLNVPKTGASPVMDTAALRQGGIENF